MRQLLPSGTISQSDITLSPFYAATYYRRLMECRPRRPVWQPPSGGRSFTTGNCSRLYTPSAAAAVTQRPLIVHDIELRHEQATTACAHTVAEWRPLIHDAGPRPLVYVLSDNSLRVLPSCGGRSCTTFFCVRSCIPLVATVRAHVIAVRRLLVHAV